MRINKEYKINLFFFISYGIFLVFNILNTSFYRIYLEDIIMPVDLFCIVLLFLNETSTIHRCPVRSILWIIAISAISIVLVTKSNEVMGIVCALFFAYFGRNINFKTVARFTVIVEGFMVFLVAFSAVLGLIKNYVYISDSGRIRFYIGFLYALYPSSYLFNITALSVYISGSMIKWKKIAGLFALNFIVFSLTNSRLAFCMSLLVLCVSILLKIRPNFFHNKKACLYVLLFSFIASCFLSVIMCDMYDDSVPWMKQLNVFTGSRIRLGQSAHLQYGYSLFGQEIEFIGNGLQKDGTKKAGAYNYVDNVYLRLLVQRGAIFLIFYVGVYTLAIKRAIDIKDYQMVCILAILSLWGIIDDLILSLGYNTFWFVVGTLVFSRRKSRLGIEKNIMLSGKISPTSEVWKCPHT